MGWKEDKTIVNVHVHLDTPPELAEDLHQMRLGIRRLEEKVRIIMATEAEVLQMLTDADTATNEIASDLQDLIDKLNAIPQVPDAITSAASAMVTKLQGVASVHPAPAPVPTPPPDPVERNV